MLREDWLLLLIGATARPGGLDPIRVQKGMFLLSQEGGLPAPARYRFRPYNYGPMSVEVYRDLDALTSGGWIRHRASTGHRWTCVSLSDRGRARCELARARASARTPQALRHLGEIGALLDRLSFAELLEYVYSRYPRYAARSVFRP